MARIERHPILKPKPPASVPFTFDGRPLLAVPGETISSALFAAGIRIFGTHPKDDAPQGIFCANGQCAQCMVMADGTPVKACMTPVSPDMAVESMAGLPELPDVAPPANLPKAEPSDIDVLIVGGGPAGMSAALELASASVPVLLVDDKDRLGGKLVLQTHRFFGSTDAVYAGTRGIDIGVRLADALAQSDSAQVWLNSTAVAVYSDGVVGVLKDGAYVRVRPKVLLAATGAREKSLVFEGNTLPGVYGAGAFQTLVNRDLVKAAERLFIVGGGNVGLIAGYHALQAGIEVVGLVEALPECGGYKVHRDKLARMGVPIYTSHTILSANGTSSVESVTIARLDQAFSPIANTEQTFACDTVLIAVGLDPVDEFTDAAKRIALPVYAAGDAAEIAEASAAIFSGRMIGRQIALDLGATTDSIPDEWARMSEILKSRPGKTVDRSPAEASQAAGKVTPVFHCSQEIPCNPCASVCPQGLIHIDASDIRHTPEYVAERVGKDCIGCMRCVAVCPGLAITLVDAREDAEHPTVVVPLEFGRDAVAPGSTVLALDAEGEPLGRFVVHDIVDLPANDRTILVRIQAPADVAPRIAGIRMQESWVGEPLPEAVEPLHDHDIVCRCERVTAGEIRALIRAGHRDMNEIKALTRAGMGACGGKTCRTLILRLFRECGVLENEIIDAVPRPLFIEVPLGTLAGDTSTGRVRSSRAGNPDDSPVGMVEHGG